MKTVLFVSLSLVVTAVYELDAITEGEQKDEARNACLGRFQKNSTCATVKKAIVDEGVLDEQTLSVVSENPNCKCVQEVCMTILGDQSKTGISEDQFGKLAPVLSKIPAGDGRCSSSRRRG